jgi:hypothetical protein
MLAADVQSELERRNRPRGKFQEKKKKEHSSRKKGAEAPVSAASL